MRVCALVFAAGFASKPPVKEPVWLATSQPMALTSLPFCSLKYSTPSTKPSMKIVTVGICRPPKVPTVPVFE